MNKYLKYSLIVSTTTFLGTTLFSFWQKRNKDETKGKTLEKPKQKQPKMAKEKIEEVKNDKETSEYYQGYLVQTGARGGKYYINEKGKKIYLKQ